MKLVVLTMILCAPLFLLAQANVTNKKVLENAVTNETWGIKWVENLSWQQVRENAKRENKYIFVDCYTTWCAPCKKMDKDVFSNKDVGEFINEKFIAVK